MKKNPKNATSLNVPVVKQRDGYSCGAACLRSVFSYFEGKSGRISAIPCPVDGLPPSQFAREFRSRDYRFVAGNMTVNDLKHHISQGRPVICLTQLNNIGHYVVVYRVDRSMVYFMCPVHGERRLSSPEFVRDWHDTDSDGITWRWWGIAAW